MSKFLNSVIAATLLASPVAAEKFGLGRAALPEEIAAWDLDIAPDGTGLPAGSGNAIDGDELFAEHCAICHGDFAEGVDNWPKLAGGMDTLDHEDPLKTVGSYWPYLSTVFDYVRRSMPFGNAQSLSDDDVYAITAYILYSNDLIDDDFELSKETFLTWKCQMLVGLSLMTARKTEYAVFTEACMSDCKDSVEITMRALVLDVTPEEEGAEEAAAEPVVEVAAVEEAPAEPEVVAAAFDAELAAEGEKVFKKCKACHQVGEGAANKSGPALNGIVGASIGHMRTVSVIQRCLVK
jgi:cytochrome c2